MGFSFWAREDNGTANNPALNMTPDPAVELTFVADVGGDLLLETNGGAADPDTLVEIGGTAYNFTYELSGTMPTQNRDGAHQVPDHLEGELVVIITVHDYPTPGESTRFAFMPEAGATEADLNDFGNGAIDVQGATTNPTEVPVCFVRGSLIACERGEVPVEELRPGDMVRTWDGGMSELRWVAQSHFDYGALLADARLRPVCIPRDIYGRGYPAADLWVSGQHRIVMHGWRVELTLGTEAALIPARHLMGVPGVPGARWTGGVEYFHLLFDRHEIVLANGLPCESLFPGDQALECVGPEARRSLEAHVRRHGAVGFAQTALPTLKAHEAAVFGGLSGNAVIAA